MIKFLRRSNRGLVLGLLLILGIAVYFVVDARAFERQRYEVREAIVDFLAALEDINNLLASDAPQTQQRAEIDAFIARFYVDFRPPFHHHQSRTTRQAVIENLAAALSDDDRPVFMNEKTFTLERVTNITKAATNAVSVQFEVRYEMEGRRDAMHFNGLHLNQFHSIHRHYEIDAYGNLVFVDLWTPEYGTHTGTINFDVTFIRSGGEWRIGNMWASSWVSGFAQPTPARRVY